MAKMLELIYPIGFIRIIVYYHGHYNHSFDQIAYRYLDSWVYYLMSHHSPKSLEGFLNELNDIMTPSLVNYFLIKLIKVVRLFTVSKVYPWLLRFLSMLGFTFPLAILFAQCWLFCVKFVQYYSRLRLDKKSSSPLVNFHQIQIHR